jgi:hypothetical protein
MTKRKCRAITVTVHLIVRSLCHEQEKATKSMLSVKQLNALDCTPGMRHGNFCDRHFEDDLWQQEERPVNFRRRSN